MVAFWAAANTCNPTPLSEPLSDLDLNDSTRIRLDTYFECAEGVAVTPYTLGGGHAWAGGSQYAPRFVIGQVSGDLPTGEPI